MNPKEDISFDEANRLFAYDPDTGVLTRKVPAGRFGQIKAGTVVGCKCSSGHLQVRVNGRLHLVHRICYTLISGKPPLQYVDHINGIKSDNRKANLRDVSKAENCQNLKGPMKSGSSGYLGVTRNGRNWKCSVSENGKQKYLGTFKSKEDAYQVFLQYKRSIHNGCTL